MDQIEFNRLKQEADKLIAHRHYAKAICILESMLDQDPDNPEIYSLLGDVLQNVNKIDAIAYYKKGLDLHPKNAYLNTGLGFLYFNGKDFANAERYFINIWVEDPTNIRLLTALGKIYKIWKQYEKAMKFYRICERLEPQNSFALYGLADTYRGMGSNNNALKYWLKFHDVEPRNKVAITRIGDCYTKLNDKENALHFYQKAIDIGYDFFAYIGAAKIYFLNNNTEKALEIYEKISTIEQNNSRYFYEYISFCLESGMKEKAFKLHNEASNLFPGNMYIESLNSKIFYKSSHQKSISCDTSVSR